MPDFLLRGGTLYDGAGGAPTLADAAITGDTITDIGELSHLTAGTVIDVTGCAVSPGFIDIHTHSDFSILSNRTMTSSLAQGVTTEVVGNCGVSIALMDASDHFVQERRWAESGGVVVDWSRLSEWMQRVSDAGVALNVASLAGHGTIRKGVMGFDNRVPSADELARMQHRLAQALDDGAIGFSTGLEYLPGSYAAIDEQASLAKIVADAGGFYATHIRNEGDTLVESIQEAITVAERSGVPLQLSHHKCEGHQNWGKVSTTLAMMSDARARGLDVLTDQYPYTAFMTGMSVILLPDWARDGSADDVVARLRDPETRARIKSEILASDKNWDQIQVGIARNHPDVQGMTLTALGAAEGKLPVDSALDLLLSEEGWVAGVHFAMSEEEVEQILRDPHTMIGSDGVAQMLGGPMSGDKTHPRSFGTFPRVLSRYVRDREVIGLSEAIRRMTSLPAQRLKLTDRGRIGVGMKADLCVFDPSLVRDQATFDLPYQLPTGISHVLVNGQLAIRDGIQTEALAGRILRRG